MTVYDFFILAAIAVSSLIGFFRGGTREIIDLLSIVVAIIVDGLLSGVTEPIGRKFIHPAFVGNVIALIIVFAIVYMGVRWAGAIVGRQLHENKDLNPLDRGLGIGFGLLRALVFVGAVHLFMMAVTPADRMPQWFSHAKLYRVGAVSAKTVQMVLPHAAKMADAVAPKVETSIRAGAAAHPSHGYSKDQRDNMDAIVEKSR
ncbi:MAG TPA: CvpA family protein [Caulobacteraceae bacterium]|jgi:membrane protein required for colicin V production